MKSRVLIRGTFHQILLPPSIPLFAKLIKEEFGKQIAEQYKIQYKDAEGDLVTISTQEDYEIALEDMKDPTLYFTIMEQGGESNKLQFTGVKSTYIPCCEDEKIVHQESKANNVDNTDSTDNAEKDKRSDEVEEDKKDDKEEVSKECFLCSGKGTDTEGETCKVCKGTGVETAVIGVLKKHLEKTLREGLDKMVQERVQRSFMSQSNMLNSLMANLSQSSLVQHSVVCSVCQKEVGPGESVYHCLLCPQFYSCDACEDNANHRHSLARGRRADQKKNYEVKVLNSTKIKGRINPGEVCTSVWRLKNSGKNKWPENVELRALAGDDLKAEVSEVESLFPGEQCDVLIKFKAPMVERKYREVFQLEARGVKFGEKVAVEVEVKCEDEYPEDKKEQSIEERIARVRKITGFKPEYEENLRTLLENQKSLDEVRVLRLLKEHDNNLPEVIALLFSKKS